MREYMRKRRQEPEFKEREKERCGERKKEIQKWFQDYKKILACEIGNDSRDYVLEFHHHKGEKENTISRMVWKSYSIKTILSELKKCKILCANCHKEHHHRERQKK